MVKSFGVAEINKVDMLMKNLLTPKPMKHLYQIKNRL